MINDVYDFNKNPLITIRVACNLDAWYSFKDGSVFDIWIIIYNSFVKSFYFLFTTAIHYYIYLSAALTKSECYCL